MSLNWLPETAYLYILIFARVGSILMLMPALGEQTIPARMRLSFALIFAAVIYPIVSPTLPPLTGDVLQVVLYLLHEIAIGLILGAITRLITLAAAVAGSVIAFQSGLSGALGADPTNGGIQGALLGTFLSMLGVALIFATDLHHVALMAIRDSYMIFSPSQPIMWGDAAQVAIQATASAFVIGVQMAAPFLVLGLVFYLGMGLLGRMMPQLQVFFIAMPLTIWAGLALLALLLAMMMGWYLTHFENELATLRGA
ncbi:MAG: flagellar type III secretion system protein FliR [Hyphomicrobiales bacterium]|nr:MAG: flagellar type III secretion system protein FliR [Hyphomicrobiales bacterium]